jgi:hypothetical protein
MHSGLLGSKASAGAVKPKQATAAAMAAARRVRVSFSIEVLLCIEIRCGDSARRAFQT